MEPNQTNAGHWLDNLYSKFQPVEQARWNQSNIDTLFYAGDQRFINRYFSFTPQSSAQQYYFNLVQQPINMVTGYQRQHRKSLIYLPTELGDSRTTDQYSTVINNQCHANGIYEAYSKSCELAAVAGMNLMQPYLDFTGDDPAQGELKLKVWEYNSFLIDPYFREPDMSDCQFVWTQEFIDKKEAIERFPDQENRIQPMTGSPQKHGRFYFLPENYNMARNNLLVLSQVWYRSKKKKKRLYSPTRHQFFDFGGGESQLERILFAMDKVEVVEVDVPTWKVALILNDQLMWQGENPLGYDSCPFIANFWNYDPHINQYDLRTRSLVRPMRDPQFLLNRQIIISHEQKETTSNSGWKRKSNAVVNEEGLKRGLNGWDIVIDNNYEMTDVEKIQPTIIPESDFMLADRMADFIFKTSGVNMESWTGDDNKMMSGLTLALKQGANLLVLQKYFDQWDYALKLLGDKLLQIVMNNWTPEKIEIMIGEEPTDYFYSRIFAKYKVVVEEGLNTPTQRSMQAQQLLDINQLFGREVFPPSMIVKDMNLAGRSEAMEFLQMQEMQQQQMQQHNEQLSTALEDAKLKEMYAKAANELAMARERHGRAEADIGLFEERLSEITHNRAMATKAKMDAVRTLVETVGMIGEQEAQEKLAQVEGMKYAQEASEDREKLDAKRTSLSNDMASNLMGKGLQQTVQQAKQGMAG